MDKKYNSKELKRLESTRLYLDALQEKHSKLLLVRVDLSYGENENVSLEQANKDFNRLLNNRRGKPKIFEHNIGYTEMVEHTEKKGVHFHTAFIFDGQKVNKDQIKGEQLGVHWRDNITNGKGVYYNCNRNDYGEHHGIGMLEHHDKEKRKKADEALAYLCKDDEDQNIQKVNTNNTTIKQFRRGRMPQTKSKTGRPRKESNL